MASKWASWQAMPKESELVDAEVSNACDTFGEAQSEIWARRFELYGYTFTTRKPR